MKKYLTAYTLNVNNQLVYRLNFFIGRFRGIVVLILLFYLWTAVTGKTGAFAGYSETEIITYIFGAHILRAFVFAQPLYTMAKEINDGSFSRHLVKPLHHFWYVYARSWADRMLFTISAIIEVIVCAMIFQAEVIWQTDSLVWLIFVGSIIVAHALYFFLNYAVSLIAFWSREAMGPRFLYEWIARFSAGLFFPITIVSPTMLAVLKATPFVYVLFFPLELYLGRLGTQEIYALFGMQALWLLATGCLVSWLWNRGLIRYSGEGI